MGANAMKFELNLQFISNLEIIPPYITYTHHTGIFIDVSIETGDIR